MLKKIFVLIAFTAILVGCAKPLPSDKQDYAGTWQSSDGRVNLIITPEGRVEYSNQQPNSSSSISAPISKFEGANFSTGFGPISTEFKVTEAPKAMPNGTWTMTVDGRELNKVH